MTMNTDYTLLATAAFFGGCTVVLLVLHVLRPLKWRKMRRQVDALIKVRLTQQLQSHEARCPMVQVFTQPDGSFIHPEATPPDVKKQNHKFLFSFMMTNYPNFVKELGEHTHTRLSITEQQTCFLVKLGMRNKQIAECIGVSPNSVIKTKQRLRPKLAGAPEGEELTRWIQQLGEPLSQLPPGYMVFTDEQTPEDKGFKIKR